MSALPPSPGSPTTSKPSAEAQRPSLKVCTSGYASDSDPGVSPTLLNSALSSTLEVPTVVVVESPQPNTHRLSPSNRGRSHERSGSSSFSRSNSLGSEGGGGYEEWRSEQTFQFEIPKPLSKSNPWEAGYTIAREHDKEMCNAWREGINTLLIFAGLFSAALVAFLAISCPMLNPDANQIQNDLLRRLTVQLQLQSESGVNYSVTLPSMPPLPSTFQPSSHVIVTNICWFFSLSVSLGTVLLGTVCLQWIREFERDPRLGFKEAFEFRQMRYEGLTGWGIPFIISCLPVLLQVSLLLFFLGLSFFLQSFDPFIAKAISVLMALIIVFLWVTMMLPAMQCIASSSKNHHQRSSLCPFKSPHALLFCLFSAWFSLFLIRIFRFLSSNPRALQQKQNFFEKILRDGSSWTSVDMAWLETSKKPPDNYSHSPAALAWLAKTYAPSHDALYTFYHCLRDIDSPEIAIETLRKLSSDTSRNPDWRIEHWNSKDIQSAFALDNFVKASPQLHNSLLLHRVELFVRILNQGLISGSLCRCQGRTANVCSLFEGRPSILAVPLDESDFVILGDAYKLQLIKTFLTYLEGREMHDFLTDIVIKLIHKIMTTKPLTSDQMLRDELTMFNKKLNDHLQSSDEKFRCKVKKLAKQYVEQFGGDGYTGRFSNFKNTLKCLAAKVESDRRKDGGLTE